MRSARPDSRGLFTGLLSLFGSFGRYFAALGALAGEEAHAAAALYLRLAIMLGAAIFFAAFGYILLLLFVAFLLAMVFHVGWIWILLGLTLLHLVVAFVCALHVKTHWRTPIFATTRAEILRDLQAMKSGDLR